MNDIRDDIMETFNLVQEQMKILDYCNTQPTCRNCKYKGTDSCKAILDIKKMIAKASREEK